MAFLDRVIERSMTDQQETHAAEVGQLIEAAYAVVARTGSFDPPIRAILAEAGLSNPAFYRHFHSKDELMLVLLDEGRRQLVAYLDHRTASCLTADERTAEWVRGVLAQSTEPTAAHRTRPFVTGVERLHEKFPVEQEASEQQLIDQLGGVLGPGRTHWAPIVATVVFGALERHMRTESPPSDDDVEHLVAFVLAGVEATW